MSKIAFLFLLMTSLMPCLHAQDSAFENRIKEAKIYCSKQGLSNGYALFFDFSKPSSEYRFFLVDLKKGNVVVKGYGAHGSGSGEGVKATKFSNEPNSLCTSLGKYKIANSYTGSFGYSYRLDGLEKTNSNARKRAIVFHSMSCIDEKQQVCCLSWGCPAISKENLQKVKPYITEQKTLLWVYD